MYEAYFADSDARYEADCHMVATTISGGHYHCTLPEGTHAHHTREALMYAYALLNEKEAPEWPRALEIIPAVLALQDTDPTSRRYGIWPMYREEPLSVMAVPDYNYADFVGSAVLRIILDHGDKLPDELLGWMREAAGHAAWSIFRRNIQPEYSNIAFSGGAVTAAAGEVLGEGRLLDYARRRLTRIIDDYCDTGGFNEYNSPGYTLACKSWMDWALHYVKDVEVRTLAKQLNDFVWKDYADHYHPLTGQLSGPQARSYANWMAPARVAQLREGTGLDLPARGREDTEETQWSLMTGIPQTPCPPAAVERFRELPAANFVQHRRYIKRATKESSVCGVTWFSKRATLGSVNHDSLWVQRRPVLGYWGSDEDLAVCFRVRFLHDGKDFASAYLTSAQKGPRILSAASLLTDKGDWHDHIDCPAIPGRFEAERFSWRYELTGRGVRGERLDERRFVLAAGDRRVVVHTASARFGDTDVEWRLGQELYEGDLQAYVEAVCYEGPRRTFQFQEVAPIVLAAGCELLANDDPASEAPIEVTRAGNRLQVQWAVKGGLEITTAAVAHPYA